MARHGGAECGETERRIGLDCNLGRVAASDFRGIDIEPDDFEPVIDAPAGNHRHQPCADTEHHIGVFPQLVAVRRGQRQRMTGIDGAERAARHHNRRLQQFGERQQIGAGIDGAAAGEDQRVFGLPQHLRRRRDTVGIGFGYLIEVGRIDRRDIGPRLHDVECHLDLDRPRPAGMELTKRLGHGAGRVAGRVHPRRPFGQALSDLQLVGQFVKLSGPLADQRRRDLADNAQHLRIQRIAGGDSR